MKKENVLSVLIDESGDFGKLDNNHPFYYVLMVLHEQDKSIIGMVSALEDKLENWGLVLLLPKKIDSFLKVK